MKLFDKLTQTKFYKFILLHKKIFAVVIALILIISGIIINNLGDANDIKKVNAESIASTSIKEFTIKISGEVKKQKTLVFQESVYLFEIIDMCGGLSDNADTNGLDLLKTYNSDSFITISRTSQKQDNNIYQIDISSSSNTILLYIGRIDGRLNIYKVDKNDSLYEVLFKINVDNNKYQDIILDKDLSYINTSSSNSGLININTCSLEELTKLDKIGLATANKIIEYRNEHGSFTKIEDIMNVKGIGESIFLSIKDKICVG